MVIGVILIFVKCHSSIPLTQSLNYNLPVNEKLYSQATNAEQLKSHMRLFVVRQKQKPLPLNDPLYRFCCTKNRYSIILT